MITVKCKTEHTVTLTALRQFQGDLKKRSPGDIEALTQSIQNDGLLMPFAIWQHDEQCSILDGHARYEALIRMAIDDPTILEQELPYILVEAEDVAAAKKALLQITSTYGRVTKKGLTNFIATIPSYTVMAPIAVKTLTVKSTTTTKVDTDSVILRLKVQKDMVKRLTEVLAGVEGVAIL
jgi:hypothetical protein